jgi:hypothetical protein
MPPYRTIPSNEEPQGLKLIPFLMFSEYLFKIYWSYLLTLKR